MGEIKLFEASNQLNKLLHKTIHSKYHTLVMPAGQNCVNATKLFQIMEKQQQQQQQTFIQTQCKCFLESIIY